MPVVNRAVWKFRIDEISTMPFRYMPTRFCRYPESDADRVVLCDETGALVDGDDIMAIAALDLLADGKLAKKTLVTTVMSNAGLDAAINAAGGRVVRTPVGDRQVIDEMLRHGFNFGGEQSGHMIFREHSTTGDGLVAALQVLLPLCRRRQGRAPDIALGRPHALQSSNSLPKTLSDVNPDRRQFAVTVFQQVGIPVGDK